VGAALACEPGAETPSLAELSEMYSEWPFFREMVSTEYGEGMNKV
jgi:phosphoenolpyruvate carboxylase